MSVCDNRATWLDLSMQTTRNERNFGRATMPGEEHLGQGRRRSKVDWPDHYGRLLEEDCAAEIEEGLALQHFCHDVSPSPCLRLEDRKYKSRTSLRIQHSHFSILAALSPRLFDTICPRVTGLTSAATYLYSPCLQAPRKSSGHSRSV